MSLLDGPKPASFFSRHRLPNNQMLWNDNVFTSPNRERLPNPLPPFPEIGHKPSPKELRYRCWATETAPYLPFVFNSPLFGPMMSRFEQFKIEHDSHGWHLPRDTSKSWKRFEHGMRDVAAKLSSYFLSKNPDLRCIWDIPEKPGSYGYFDAFESEQKAREAVARSIDGFVIYSAYLSFLIALCRFCPPSITPSQTTAELFHSAGIHVHPEWIQGLHDSGIGNFNVEQRSRVGLIINIPHCDWINLVPFMIMANVPVWLHWGQPPFIIPQESWVSDLQPQFFSPPPPAQPNPAPSVPDGFPPVLPHSGQRSGESLQDFLTRRKERNARIRAQETSDLRERREKREQANAKHPLPGKKGPKVYYWEKVDGFRIRTLITRALVPSYWPTWRKSQRKYDSYSNEYDCCSEFPSDSEDDHEDDDTESDCSSTILPYGPKRKSSPVSDLPPVTTLSQDPPPACPPLSQRTHDMLVDTPPEVSPEVPQHPRYVDAHCRTSSSTGYSGEFPISDPPLPPSMPHSPTAPPASPSPARTPLDMVVDAPINDSPKISRDPPQAAQTTWRTNGDDDMEDFNPLDASVQDVVAVNPSTGDKQPPPPIQSIEELLHFRFGYSYHETSYRGLPKFFDEADDPFTDKWTTVCRAVGGQGLSSLEANHRPIADFLVALLNSPRPFHDVPWRYWDLSPWNAFPFSSNPKHFNVEVKEFESGLLCLLHPRTPELIEDVPWTVAVPPITALESIRRGFTHSIDIAEYLISHGMAFNTLLPLERDLESSSQCSRRDHWSSSSGPRPFLGDRPAGYQFDRADYASYSTLRDSFLLGQWNCRRALSFGGLVARFARDVLADSDILTGPSQSALRGNQQLFIGDGQVMVDDQLSDEALDLLCGTYKVPTGKGDQTSMRSWFPRHNVWASTGLNAGHWNQECEEWYQKRLRAILDGAQPLSQHQWRDQIRMTRQTPKLVFQMNKAAEAYLRSAHASSFTYSPMSD